ncbi:hypothetical protein BDW59DRAFT_152404 [Aspergillus cavernicola]|uniref:Nucleoside phosphorylase domain-containing protein n=1 Tax=Aspergillus cavernicola TaxID=176166 RepID=A0ABR4HQT9_9EURO
MSRRRFHTLSDGESNTDWTYFDDRQSSRTSIDGSRPRPSASIKRKFRGDQESLSDYEMNKSNLSHNDYTIAWICALPIEMAAATAMLDTIHETLPSRGNDPNVYTLGTIDMHRVVITCLPSGYYGTNNAATVASNLLRTFPAIHAGLMVGIGGGVPGPADIRLGDIVVSHRVVQYDLGKSVGGEHFIRTSVPTRPSQALLTAVAKLRARHALESSRVAYILSEMLDKYPMMTKYTYRGDLQDRLFGSAYYHAQEAETCDHCDVSRLVPRKCRRGTTNPEIHYGVIASGNQVMKDGITRDRLAQELGAICFEMEAAGLMDSLPCLVIRGICDYSDSHKNDQWQEYAAATAAAYAKELLSVIPAPGPKEIETPDNRSDNPTRQRKLLESLKSDHIDVRRSAIKPHHVATCKWLLTHPDYLDWLDPSQAPDHHGFLWIRGKPGAGKSTIMNFAYNQAMQVGRNTVISFFFNARGDTFERSTDGMYRSLLFQLLNQLPRLQAVIDSLEYKKELDQLNQVLVGQNRLPQWPTRLLQDLLRAAIGMLDQECLVVFIDALDECDEYQVEEMVDFFEGLGEHAVSGGKSFLTCFSSRHYPYIDIEHGLKLTLELQEGHEEDIATYIASKLRIGRGNLAEEVKVRLRLKAGGIFMWVVLVVNILNKEYKSGRVFAVQKRMETIPTELSALFKEILWKEEDNLEDLQLCIQWVLFAGRPLSPEEYYFAGVSGLSPDDLREWDPEEVTTEDMIKFVLSSSRGLAEVTDTWPPTVQFIHESVREFFLGDGLQEVWPNLTSVDFEPSSHNQLQQYCHTNITHYLASTISSEESERVDHITSFPFIKYATCYVLYHSDAAAVACQQDKFLKDFSLRDWIKLINIFEAFNSYTPTASLLYILAERNLARLILTVLSSDPRVEILGERYRYPFFAALARGHEDAAKSLLQHGKTSLLDDIAPYLQYEPNLVPPEGQTPLLWAAEQGHAPLVKLMVEKPVSLNARDQQARTPLLWAAQNRSEDMARVLVERGADIDAQDDHGWTPLLWASQNGHEAVVKLLVDKGADVDAKVSSGLSGWTPLLWAAENGHEAVINLLLEKGADINARVRSGWTPLLCAAENGHEDAVKLLLDNGADVFAKDNSGWTPLFFAAGNGDEGILKLLLDNGADPDAKNEEGQTALSCIIEDGYFEDSCYQSIIQLLQQR